MWSLKVSWSSKNTSRFQTETDGVIVDEANWIVKSCLGLGIVWILSISIPIPIPILLIDSYSFRFPVSIPMWLDNDIKHLCRVYF